jgi:hypothetical protein
MDRTIYVLIKEDDVKCYPNLTQLIGANPSISYSTAYKALRKNRRAIVGNVTIAVDTMHYKTKRRFSKGSDDGC